MFWKKKKVLFDERYALIKKDDIKNFTCKCCRMNDCLRNPKICEKVVYAYKFFRVDMLEKW